MKQYSVQPQGVASMQDEYLPPPPFDPQDFILSTDPTPNVLSKYESQSQQNPLQWQVPRTRYIRRSPGCKKQRLINTTSAKLQAKKLIIKGQHHPIDIRTGQQSQIIDISHLFQNKQVALGFGVKRLTQRPVHMRAFRRTFAGLVDWLLYLTSHFSQFFCSCSWDTYFGAIDIFQRVCQRAPNLQQHNLCLIGLGCFRISSKLHGTKAPSNEKICHSIVDQSLSPRDLEKSERDIVALMDDQFYEPTVYFVFESLIHSSKIWQVLTSILDTAALKKLILCCYQEMTVLYFQFYLNHEYTLLEIASAILILVVEKTQIQSSQQSKKETICRAVFESYPMLARNHAMCLADVRERIRCNKNMFNSSREYMNASIPVLL